MENINFGSGFHKSDIFITKQRSSSWCNFTSLLSIYVFNISQLWSLYVLCIMFFLWLIVWISWNSIQLKKQWKSFQIFNFWICLSSLDHVFIKACNVNGCSERKFQSQSFATWKNRTNDSAQSKDSFQSPLLVMRFRYNIVYDHFFSCHRVLNLDITRIIT